MMRLTDATDGRTGILKTLLRMQGVQLLRPNIQTLNPIKI